MENNGWNFNTSHSDKVWRNEECGNEGWFGLHAGHNVGSVSVKFKASGNATLTFGNCWHVDRYTVKVYLNENLLATAGGNELKVVTSFPFDQGDILKIDEDGAIIKLNSLIISC